MKKKITPVDKIINFIKYHNAFPIAVSLIFLSLTAVFAASPQMREDFKGALVSAKETVRSIDNTYIVSIDLDSFDFSLQITDIKEDTDNYYISYAFKTIYIQDYVWQELSKQTTLTVSKQALANNDLGLYVAEELGEVINSQLAYLKEVQQIEKQKGLSQKVVATEYAGLIGRFLNPKEEIFPGYEPVVSPLAIVLEPSPLAAPVAALASPAPQPVIDRDLIRQIVEELLAQERQSSLISAESPAPSPGVRPLEASPAPITTSEPSPSPSPTESPTLTPTESPAVTPEPSPEPIPSPTPEASVLPTPSLEPSPSETPTASPSPSPEPSPEPSAPSEPTPSPAEEPTPAE